MTAQRALPQTSHQRSSSSVTAPARRRRRRRPAAPRASRSRAPAARAEAPRPHAHPAEVLGAVAGVDELPVDQRRPRRPRRRSGWRAGSRRARSRAAPVRAGAGAASAGRARSRDAARRCGRGGARASTTAASAAASPERSGPEPWPASSGSCGQEAGRLDRVQPRGGLRHPRDQHRARAAPSARRAAGAAAAPRRPPARRRSRTASARPASATGTPAVARELQHLPLAEPDDVARLARAGSGGTPTAARPTTTDHISQRPGAALRAARSRSARRRAPRRQLGDHGSRVAGHAALRVHAQPGARRRSAPSRAAAAGCRRRARPSARAGR